MDYGKVLSRAWKITWRWKALWILGFLASLGQGWSGGGNTGYTTDRGDWGWRYGGIPPEVWIIIAAAVCLALLIGIALWVISVIARGGLIAGVQQAEDKGSTGFGQAWRVGAKRFWTLFGISILTALPTLILVLAGVTLLVLLIVATVGAFEGASEVVGTLGIIASVLCGGILCCGGILLAIVLDQIRVYAERAAILEGLGWIDAFKRGWQVLRTNLGPTIIFWLIFFVIGLALAAVIFGVLFAVLVPFIAIVAHADPGPWLLAPICCGGILAAIVGALISSIVTTFSSATWTLAYRQFTSPGTDSAVAAQPAAAE